MVALSLLGIVGAAFGLDSYPTSYHWGFQNYCYLGFNQAMNFTDAPHQGASNDSSLVGYWNLNEVQGAVAHDSSGNGNNGTITGASWVDGKYGKALSLNENINYVQTNSFPLTGTKLTFSAWIYLNSLTGQQIIIGQGDGGYGANGYIYVYNQDGALGVGYYDTTYRNLFWSNFFTAGEWVHLAVVQDFSTLTVNVYKNGVQLTPQNMNAGAVYPSWSYAKILGAYTRAGSIYLNGIIDEVRIYNRTLSEAEVAALYTQPDPVIFVNYYSYTDPVTNNTMLIHVNNPNASSNNVVLVTCTNFFADNRLSFQANDSAIVTVWTSLGQPAFTTGVWNSQNYTTTLTLNDASTAELNWKQPTTSPQINPFPVEALIVVAAIAIIIAVLALAFKKGYIIIEGVKESPEDYTI